MKQIETEWNQVWNFIFTQKDTEFSPWRDTSTSKKRHRNGEKIMIKSQSNLLVAQPWRSPGKGDIIFFIFSKFKKVCRNIESTLQTAVQSEPLDRTMDDSLNDLPEKYGTNGWSPKPPTVTRRSWLIQPFGVSLACEATWLQKSHPATSRVKSLFNQSVYICKYIYTYEYCYICICIFELINYIYIYICISIYMYVYNIYIYKYEYIIRYL